MRRLRRFFYPHPPLRYRRPSPAPIPPAQYKDTRHRTYYIICQPCTAPPARNKYLVALNHIFPLNIIGFGCNFIPLPPVKK